MSRVTQVLAVPSLAESRAYALPLAQILARFAAPPAARPGVVGTGAGALTDDRGAALRTGRADLAAAQAAHAEALALLGRAEARERRPARLRVLAAYRSVVDGYLRDGNPLLAEAPAAVRALLARWRDGP